MNNVQGHRRLCLCLTFPSSLLAQVHNLVGIKMNEMQQQQQQDGAAAAAPS